MFFHKTITYLFYYKYNQDIMMCNYHLLNVTIYGKGR